MARGDKLQKRPKELIVIGASRLGLEFAQGVAGAKERVFTFYLDHQILLSLCAVLQG
jgi:pyruvate/2-oxoglutarate dehydrogenase complex dihydrolipoamide dehydrogenase (E3) component